MDDNERGGKLMPFLALTSLGVMFGGVMYLRDERCDLRRMEKLGIIAGVIGVTLVAMAATGPMIALILFAVFVAASFLTQFWS